MNKVIIVGRLGSDPEIKNTQNGKAVASFSVATSEKYNGNEKTEWHRIIAWEKQAEIAKNYLAKGNIVGIEGKIQSREYEDGGVKKKITEIICQSITLLETSDKSDKSDKKKIQTSTTSTSDTPDEDVPF